MGGGGAWRCWRRHASGQGFWLLVVFGGGLGATAAVWWLVGSGQRGDGSDELQGGEVFFSPRPVVGQVQCGAPAGAGGVSGDGQVFAAQCGGRDDRVGQLAYSVGPSGQVM